MKICIVIPAHNEEDRIEPTLRAYADYFKNMAFVTDFLVVLNACTDHTKDIVQQTQQEYTTISCLEIGTPGKGAAIIQGFAHALRSDYDCIGFVDADMATSPAEFHKLIIALQGVDGVIASRYMPGAIVVPPRPFIKRWGSKLFYEPLVKILFGLYYYDYQCGAKLFTRKVIETIQKHLVVTHWAFDVELLYLCKRNGFIIKEMPTEWHDQANSKLRIMGSGLRMLRTLFWLRLYYSPFKFLVS